MTHLAEGESGRGGDVREPIGDGRTAGVLDRDLARCDSASAVAEAKLGGRKDRLEEDGVVGVDKPAALLSDRLELRATD